MQTFYFEIYHVKDGPEYKPFRYTSALDLAAAGLTIDPANYKQVYASMIFNTRELTDAENLDFLFREFNVDHPDDFFAHSMSTSDIIRLFPMNGGDDCKVRAYFCDPAGWLCLTSDVMSRLPLETRPEAIRLTINRIKDAFEDKEADDD